MSLSTLIIVIIGLSSSWYNLRQNKTCLDCADFHHLFFEFGIQWRFICYKTWQTRKKIDMICTSLLSKNYKIWFPIEIWQPFWQWFKFQICLVFYCDHVRINGRDCTCCMVTMVTLVTWAHAAGVSDRMTVHGNLCLWAMTSVRH